MTWSVTHTIPYNSNADNHSAMVYLFDTVLAGKTGWTISSHPGGSAYKRRAKFTALNKVTNANYTMYSWVDWLGATPTYVNWYEDATYTTTPGDLATDSTTVQGVAINWQVAGESWKFCTSSENSQSILVLKGSRVAFYWPGITSGVFWPDPNWLAGSTDNKGTWICPMIGGNYGTLGCANSPVATNVNSSIYSLLPDAGFGPQSSSAGYRLGGSYIATNFNWLYTQVSSGSAYPDGYSHVAFANGGHTDVGVWLGSSINNISDVRQPFPTSSSGMTLQVGSNYWYSSWPDLGREGIVFNFGTTDPLA